MFINSAATYYVYYACTQTVLFFVVGKMSLLKTSVLYQVLSLDILMGLPNIVSGPNFFCFG